MKLSVVFFALLLNSLNAYASVHKVCKAIEQSNNAISYELCVSSLRSDPKSESASTHTLAVIAAKLSLANCTSTKLMIGNMLSNETDSFTRQCLETCLGFYRGTISMLVSSINSFNSGNIQHAKLKLEKAMDGPGNCDAYTAEGCRPISLTKKMKMPLDS